jgi:spore coat polysaccharide biosynthesis protein SpsF
MFPKSSARWIGLDGVVARTVIIAQARMCSTRLPGKVLMDLGGEPMVDRVLERARRARMVDEIVVATSTDPSDDVLVEHLESRGAKVLRGSLDDVLSRYMLAARETKADIVVRITCDCPLIDPGVIDETIKAFATQSTVDYCSNTLIRTYPIGMDTEVLSTEALFWADAAATKPHEREHVTPFIYQHPERFRLRNVNAPEWAAHPDWRLTVDTAEDLVVLRALYQRLPDQFGLAEIIDAIESDPGVLDANRGVPHRHIERPDSW